MHYRTFSEIGQDIYSSDIIKAHDGGFLISGYSEKNLITRGLIIKTDQFLNLQWGKYIGNIGTTSLSKIEKSKDGNYFILGCQRNSFTEELRIFLMKMTPEGTPIWSNIYKGINSTDGTTLKELNDGSILIGGSSGQNLFLLKCNPIGEAIWVDSFNHFGDINSIVENIDNTAIVVGGGAFFYALKINLQNGDVIWSKKYIGAGGANGNKFYTIFPTDDGNYLVSGVAVTWGGGGTDLFPVLLKIDPNGQPIESVRSIQYFENTSAIKTDDGNYVLMTWFGNLSKITKKGEIIWAVSIDGSNENLFMNSLVQKDNSNIIAVGHTKADSEKYSKIVIHEISPQGEMECKKETFSPVWEPTNLMIDDSTYMVSTSFQQDEQILPIVSIDLIDSIICTNDPSLTFSQIKEPQKTLFSLFPNPSNGLFNISMNGIEKAHATVFNYTGQKIIELKLEAGPITIDLQSYPPGLYFIKTKAGLKEEIFKVVKE